MVAFGEEPCFVVHLAWVSGFLGPELAALIQHHGEGAALLSSPYPPGVDSWPGQAPELFS